MNEKLRGSGRTHRMLEYAIEEAKKGKLVFIYCELLHEKQDLLNRLLSLDFAYKSVENIDYEPRINIEEGAIIFKHIGPDFDWKKLTGKGMNSNIVSLLDHWTIEREFPLITEMLYRFI